MLCGIRYYRSEAAVFAPWATNGCGTNRWEGYPRKEFFTAVDPLLKASRSKLRGDATAPPNASPAGYAMSGPANLGLRRHPDSGRRVRCALGRDRRRCRLGDIVNVIGTSTCIMGLSGSSRASAGRVRRGSRFGRSTIHGHRSRDFPQTETCSKRSRGEPAYHAASIGQVSKTTRRDKPACCGCRWDNGDRTVLVNPELGGVTLGGI